MFEGVAESNFKDIANHSSDVFLTVVMPLRWMRMLKNSDPELEVSERLA